MFGPIRHGILRSEPGFPVNINAEIVHSGDLLTIDPDQKWLHNDFSGMLKTDSGEYLRFTMKAIEQSTEGIMRISEATRQRQMWNTGTSMEISTLLSCKDHFDRSLACAYFPIKKKRADWLWRIVPIWSFITGNEKYKELENSAYVSSTLLSRGSEPDSFSVALRISQVSHVASTTDCVDVDDTIKHSEL